MRAGDEDKFFTLLGDDPEGALEWVRGKQDAADDDEAMAELLAWEAACLADLGDFDGALDAWARVVAIDPEDGDACVERVRLLVECGRLQAAEAELGVARELIGDDAGVWLAAAFLHEANGEFDEADAAIARACALDDDVEPACRLAEDAVRSAVQAAMGPEVAVAVMPMPEFAGDEGLGRACDGDGQTSVTVYQRNLERELTSDATVNELVELLLDTLDTGDDEDDDD